MAKKTIIQCDRCGRPIDEHDTASAFVLPVLGNGRMGFKIGGRLEDAEERPLEAEQKDLCRECRKEYADFWEKGKQA